MKRVTCSLLVILMVVAMLPLGVDAAEADKNVSYIYYEDGSYLKVTIDSSVQETRSHTTINGSKLMEHYNASGVLCWSAVLRGNFSYDGTIAVCNYASCDVTIYKSAYALGSKTVTKRGNCAYVTLDINMLLTGIVVGTNTYEMSLACDKNGNLS